MVDDQTILWSSRISHRLSSSTRLHGSFIIRVNHFCNKLAWVYPCCLARSKFRSARQSGGYDRFLSQEFVKIWYPITERGGTERQWRVLCDRRKLEVHSYGFNMAAAEAKLSFDVAVDSVLNSLERKFILKEEQRLALHSFITTKNVLALLPTGFLSLYIRHLV